MHFEAQRLGGVVWRSHIFVGRRAAVEHINAVGLCVGDRKQQTVPDPLHIHLASLKHADTVVGVSWKPGAIGLLKRKTRRGPLF